MPTRDLAAVTAHARERCIAALGRAGALDALFDSRLLPGATAPRPGGEAGRSCHPSTALIVEDLLTCRHRLMQSVLGLRAFESVLALLRRGAAQACPQLATAGGEGQGASEVSGYEPAEADHVEALAFFALGTITHIAQSTAHLPAGRR